jgi:cell division protease FtsH
MIGNYGMGSQLKTFYNEDVDNERSPFLGRTLSAGSKYSESTKELFDKEALQLVKKAYSEANNTLMEHKELMEELVQRLLDNEVLTGKQVLSLINDIQRLNKKYIIG